MKALILAAGRGSRMGELTAHCPKPMLPIGGRPLLEHTLRALAAAGLHEVVVVVGYLADHIIRHFGDGRDLGLDLEYRRAEGGPPEAEVLAARDGLAPNEGLLCLTGDSVISAAQIRQLRDQFEASHADAVVTVEPGGESDLRVSVAGDRVTGGSRAPCDPVLAYNMVLRRSFLEALAGWAAGRTEPAFARAMDELAPRHRVLVANVGLIVNVNRPEDLAAGEKALSHTRGRRSLRIASRPVSDRSIHAGMRVPQWTRERLSESRLKKPANISNL